MYGAKGISSILAHQKEALARRPLFNPASLPASLPPLSLDCRTHCLARVTEEEGPRSQLCKFVGIMHTDRLAIAFQEEISTVEVGFQ